MWSRAGPSSLARWSRQPRLLPLVPGLGPRSQWGAPFRLTLGQTLGPRSWEGLRGARGLGLGWVPDRTVEGSVPSGLVGPAGLGWAATGALCGLAPVACVWQPWHLTLASPPTGCCMDRPCVPWCPGLLVSVEACLPRVLQWERRALGGPGCRRRGRGAGQQRLPPATGQELGRRMLYG